MKNKPPTAPPAANSDRYAYVFECDDGWYFMERHTHPLGPYRTEAAAIEACAQE
jgi:hypothetical protein